MSTRIQELMASAVVRAAEEDTVGEVRERMESHDIGALPVVNPQGVLLGIVTSDDLLSDYPTTLPISRVMSTPVETMPPDATVADAARLMRKQGRHHVVVAEGQRVVGMLSAFDLLGLIEERNL